MKNIRTIARLDVKGNNLIKSICLEGLRKVGIPSLAAKTYYQQEIDEIIYIDLVASLYGRSQITEILYETTRDVFIPLTAGGGIRNIDDVHQLLRSGADKVAINTAAVRNPELISEVASTYGNQCMVLSIEAKKEVQVHGKFILNVEENRLELKFQSGLKKLNYWVQEKFY